MNYTKSDGFVLEDVMVHDPGAFDLTSLHDEDCHTN
jgi:hypothetical protein